MKKLFKKFRKKVLKKIEKRRNEKAYIDSMNLYSDHQRIDLIELNNFYLFVYMNDWFYNAHATKSNSEKTYKDIVKSRKLDTSGKRGTASDFIESWSKDKPFDLYVLALLDQVKTGKVLGVIDVGCLYGLESMKYARTCREYGINTRHVSFDPGLGGDLAEYNFHNNNYKDIEFFPYAISDFDGYILLNYEIGNNENSRIINPLSTEKSFSRVVKSVTLDSFLNNLKELDSVFIKIDTQGAEHEVFAGLADTLKNRIVGGIFEFFPDGLATRKSPRVLLEKLLENYALFDIGAQRNRIIRIFPGEEQNAVDRAKSGTYTWSDIVFVPNNFKYLSKLNEVAD